MKNITERIIKSFLSKKEDKISNSRTDGISLFLFGNKIAEHREDGLYITNAGWESNTTKERLNALPGVSINQKKGVWYLNGEKWDGSWVKVSDSSSNDSGSNLKSIGLVMAMGDIFGSTKKESANWKLRMLKAGIPEGALHMPDNWDELPEEEQNKRLDKIIELFNEK